MNSEDRARVEALLATKDVGRLDALMPSLHRKYHDRPLDHVRVHFAWIRVHLAGRRYLRAIGNAFAGFFAAVPASLLQRHAGLVVPAFEARNEDGA